MSACLDAADRKTREQLGLNYLPASVAEPFKEALGCYSHGLMGAFFAMCGLTARAVFDDVGEAGRLRCFEDFREMQRLAGLTPEVAEHVQQIIFGTGNPHGDDRADRLVGAATFEAMKDLLYQTYVRGGRLRSALQMRQLFAAHFADLSADHDRQGETLRPVKPAQVRAA